jgi:hypothetical protein
MVSMGLKLIKIIGKTTDICWKNRQDDGLFFGHDSDTYKLLLLMRDSRPENWLSQ